MMYTAGVNHDILSPVSFLERSTRVYPDKTAVMYGDRRYSYREFQSRIHRLANALRSSGIAPGDKVVFICPNTPPLLEAHFAVPMIGAVLVCLNIHLSTGEYRYIIDHSDAGAVFVDSEYAAVIKAIRDDLDKVELFVTINDTVTSQLLPGPDYEDFIARGADVAPDMPAVIDEDTPITINYTS
jgi:fatty-acyl-CoA synthase